MEIFYLNLDMANVITDAVNTLLPEEPEPTPTPTPEEPAPTPSAPTAPAPIPVKEVQITPAQPALPPIVSG